MGALLVLGVAASIYLVCVLEILKLRRLRAWQLRRADPDTTEHEIDEQVRRELETGEFRHVLSLDPPILAAPRHRGRSSEPIGREPRRTHHISTRPIDSDSAHGESRTR